MSYDEVIEVFKQNKIMLLIITFSFVVLLGSSYAWYSVSIESDKKHTITAGDLSLLLQDNQDSITLTNAVPQTDEEGMENPSYRFTITNNGSLNSRYFVYLEDADLTTGTERMSDSVIKYSLKSNNTTVSNGYMNTLISKNGRRRLVSGELEPNASVTYHLNVWIAEEATTEIAGQEFMTKLAIEGRQVNEPVEE